MESVYVHGSFLRLMRVCLSLIYGRLSSYGDTKLKFRGRAWKEYSAIDRCKTMQTEVLGLDNVYEH